MNDVLVLLMVQMICNRMQQKIKIKEIPTQK